jgi:hypothetical protein
LTRRVTRFWRDGAASVAGLAALSRGGDRLLPIWFLGWSLYRVASLSGTDKGWDLSFIGRDFWIYRNAAQALLDGGDPWAASHPWNGIAWHYAAPPSAAQLFVPFALVGESLALWLFLGVSAITAWAALRRLGLPAWWLLFPPMTEGLLAANPQVLLFGLLVIGGTSARGARLQARGRVTGLLVARTVAVGLKSYAIGPVIARREWRALAAIAVGAAASIAIAPALWARYVADFGLIAGRLVTEAEGGVSAALLLRPNVLGEFIPDDGMALIAGLALYGVVAGIVLLAAIRDVEAAGWLVVPLLLPGAEYHLATLAIPVARRAAIWIIAIPMIPTYLLGLIILAYQVAAGHRPMVEPRPAIEDGDTGARSVR